jgi:UDP-N-acetylmuramate dehydrogenase
MNIENKIQRNVELAPMTTYKIGGSAEYFIEADNQEELLAAVAWAKEKEIKIFILGGGSNILVPDMGVDGLVIKMNNKEIKLMGERILVGAGAMLSRLVSTANSNMLTGMEWAVGVPGTVGGAVRGNAGCFGSNIEAVIETINVYNTEKERIELFSKKDCQFSYRESIIKKQPNYIIIDATVKLIKGDKAAIDEKVQYILGKRTGAYPKLPSAGSVFKSCNMLIIHIK